MPRFILVLLLVYSITFSADLPKGFSDVKDSIPSIIVEMKYHSHDNFVGVPVKGYHSSRCILSSKATTALKKVQKELTKMNLGLKIFDAYRPQTAVNHFVEWSHDSADTKTKKAFYPNLRKNTLFANGYIAKRSGHSRGSSIDLTLVDLKTGKELDMGSIFDLFDDKSHVKSTKVTAQQRANRMLLQLIMIKHGFKPYSKEWWHFRLKNEPFPKTYFSFPVE